MPSNKLGRGEPEYRQQKIEVTRVTSGKLGPIPTTVTHRIRETVLARLRGAVRRRPQDH